MGKRDASIEIHDEDLRTKCKMVLDMALLTKVTMGCGPAIYNRGASTIATSDAAELARIRTNFLIRKLGLPDDARLDAALDAVIETYGRSERQKYRAVVYYMLTRHFGSEAAYD